ncbi:MAG: DUF2065 domain-containing protein [Pseudomonadota bacterium]
MSDLLAAIGLVLVIEGVAYALAPQAMRRMILQMVHAPVEMMRIGGLITVALGVLIVWLVRG